jgi:hypothetical protein
MRVVKKCGLGLLVVALSSFCVAASQNAVVSGAVYDASSKPMPGIRVVLDNAGLNFEREATTIEDGSYTIAEVPPHDGYRITAYRGAVKIDVHSGLAVSVGEEKNILPPLREQVAASGGSSGALVERKAAAVSTETITTMVSGVISGEQLRSLPLINRNFLVLGLLTPNTHDVEGGSALAGATFSISGSRPNTNMFLLDGTDNVARSSNQAIPFQVNDAVQEFRVISSTANAEYGGASGGVVNIVTQRGSNGLHGSVFGYFANDRFNADTPLSVYNGSGFDQAAVYAGSVTAGRVTNFAPTTYNNFVATAAALGFCTDSISGTNSAGKTPCVSGGFGKNTRFDPAAILSANDSHTQPFDSRQYGANLGGAIIKDKLFLFGSYEGTRIENPNPIFERVPTTFDKTYNPLRAAGVAGTPSFLFPSNSPDYIFAQRLLALYPTSNVVAVPGVLEFFRGEAPNYTHVNNGIAHADFVQSKSTNWSMRYAAQSLNQLHDDTLPKSSTYPGNGAVRDAFNQNVVLTHSHSWGSGLITETHAGITRFRVNETPQDSSLDATTLGMPTKQMMTVALSGLDPQTSGATPFQLGAFASWVDSFWLAIPPAGFPAIDGLASFPSLTGLFPFARLGAPLSAPGQRRDTTWLAGENVSWSKSRHIVKFGGGFRSFQNNLSNGGFSRGLLTSSNIGEFTSDSLSTIFFGEAFEFPSFDYALRQPTQYSGRFNSFAVEGFVQDTWKVHPRFTVNAGLRYDYFSPPEEANNLMYNFDPVSNGLVRTGTSQIVDPFGQKCQNPEPFPAVYPIQGLQFPSWKCSNSGNDTIANPSANDFGPRVGAAWDVFGNGNTVVRAGVGWFYDQSPSAYTSQLIFNRPTPLSLTNPQAIYGQNFISDFNFCIQCGWGNITVLPANFSRFASQAYQAAASPLPIYARDVFQSDTPRTRQVSATIQQKISAHLAGEIGYIGTAGSHLPSVANTGFNNEWFCNISPGCDALNPVFTLSNNAESSYHSLMTRVRVAEFHGLALNASYNWSKSMDNASSASFPLVPVTLSNQIFGFQFYGLGVPFRAGAATNNKGIATLSGLSALSSDTLASGVTTTGLGQVITSRYTLPQDPNNYLRDDYGRSDLDSKHRVVVDYTWDVPGIHGSSLRANLLGNWRVSGIVVAQSGQPFTVFAGPIGGEVTQRANLVGTVSIDHDNPNRYINSGAFGLAANNPGCAANFGIVTGNLFTGKVGSPCLGNTRRNEFTGPNFAKMDLALQKGVQIREGKLLTFRAEFFNLFNRANYYNPISVISVDGLTPNADFGRIKSAHEAFSVQLAARFSW